ncbi:LLM class flavin-dependent oxidoreductase, partial [Arthrobacter sp. OV608]|uniref:LLM class flavin-dependent oxidoreductase n=1 Tax=Arthrobacter sp. OV608 TaxID=1882768 RepID=UPI000B819D6E
RGGVLSAKAEEMLSVPSEAVDVRVDKWSMPVLNDENRLKLATFATNMRGSVTLANVEGKVLGSWEESLRLAQHADRIGFDAVIPVQRWRGFGGQFNLSDRSFEPFTWATALLARTQRIQAFATVQVPLIHPVMAAKMAVTADHVSGGRFGINVVAGWFPEEFAMFGLTQREHEARYAYADEWTTLLKRLWTGDAPADFSGEYIKAVDAFSDPHPLQDPYPVIMNAGTSGPGRDFAATHSDLIFASLQDMATARRQIAEIKQQALASHGREVRVFGRVHIVCRPTEQDARDYFRFVHRDSADVAAIEKLLAGVSANSDSFDVDPEEHAKTIERLAAGRGAMTIVGTPEQVVESLLELTNAGLDGVAISWVNYDEGLQQMEDEILPLMVQAGLRS